MVKLRSSSVSFGEGKSGADKKQTGTLSCYLDAVLTASQLELRLYKPDLRHNEPRQSQGTPDSSIMLVSSIAQAPISV